MSTPAWLKLRNKDYKDSKQSILTFTCYFLKAAFSIGAGALFIWTLIFPHCKNCSAGPARLVAGVRPENKTDHLCLSNLTRWPPGQHKPVEYLLAGNEKYQAESDLCQPDQSVSLQSSNTILYQSVQTLSHYYPYVTSHSVRKINSNPNPGISI